MLNTIHNYLYYKCESRHYYAGKKTSFVSSIGFYYQKKKFKVFFWCDLGGHWIVGLLVSAMVYPIWSIRHATSLDIVISTGRATLVEYDAEEEEGRKKSSTHSPILILVFYK